MRINGSKIVRSVDTIAAAWASVAIYINTAQFHCETPIQGRGGAHMHYATTTYLAVLGPRVINKDAVRNP